MTNQEQISKPSPNTSVPERAFDALLQRYVLDREEQAARQPELDNLRSAADALRRCADYGKLITRAPATERDHRIDTWVREYWIPTVPFYKQVKVHRAGFRDDTKDKVRRMVIELYKELVESEDPAKLVEGTVRDLGRMLAVGIEHAVLHQYFDMLAKWLDRWHCNAVSARQPARKADSPSVRGRSRQRGRKRAFDPKEDERLARLWGEKQHSTIAELARALGIATKDAKRAIDRHRKRKERSA